MRLPPFLVGALRTSQSPKQAGRNSLRELAEGESFLAKQIMVGGMTVKVEAFKR